LGGVSPLVADRLEYVNIVGAGYVSLLKMIIMPLIMVSIIGAIVKVKDSGSLGKISGLTIVYSFGDNGGFSVNWYSC